MSEATVKDAAYAMSDLYIFGAVVALMEGGHLHSASYDAAAKIIKICQAEQQKRLREFDRARAAIERRTSK